MRVKDADVEHLAYNAVVNGVGDAKSLDGWVDLEPKSVTMTISDVQADRLS